MSTSSKVNVLSKATAILDHLAASNELTVARLSEEMGEPRSTVYRLVASLNDLGLVEPGVQRGSHRLGLRLFRLGNSVLARFDEHTAAQPVMQRIHEESGETVFLCVRRNDEAVCIARLDGQRVQTLELRVGGSLPLHAGAAPRVLLAFGSRESWAAYLAANPRLSQLTPHTPLDPPQLTSMLEQIRLDGYAVSDGDVTEGIAALGAPVFDHSGALRAALSMSGVRQTLLEANFESNCRRIVDGASDISRLLGYDGDRPTVIGTST
jgi:DNA-binding IclR family transcriptional regulator